jgi:chromosome segregation ATPase
MKKVFAFAAFAILLSSCSNVGKYKPMIEELSANWDSATSAVTEFAGKVTAAQADMASMNSQLNVDSEVMDNWDSATKEKFGEITSSAKTSMESLSGLNNELDGFISSWQEKGADLQALKDGLAAGKLEGDVQGKIASLSAAATDATSKLSGWQDRLSEIKSSAANAKQMLADFMVNNGLGDSTSGMK